MINISDVFEKMRQTEMNEWVGGTDPEVVGDASAHILNRMVSIRNDLKILDFGCGIGRTVAAIIKSNINFDRIVGIDIIPKLINFCTENIAENFTKSSFDLSESTNEYYERFVDVGEADQAKGLQIKYNEYFDVVYAFSVFTHVSRGDFVEILKSVSGMMVPGGSFLFSCFVLTEYSRSQIENGQSVFPFDNCEYIDNGDIFVGDRTERLSFIAFDKNLLESMICKAGLVLSKVEYGGWMGGNLGSSLHDIMVINKPYGLAANDEVKILPVVNRDLL